MTLLEKHERFITLWRIALPHVTEPTIQDTARWSAYPPESVERAIMRTARRFAANRLPPRFEPLEAFKYVSSVARGDSATAQMKEVA
ncbi:hypothetical protein [Terriglobus sp. TAA 43]|uniref:hypothetical protein n=1 Tax=Terriglobus sp. TAA 43 TaxID=278961 RepID=UPI000645EF64|nr:hypothetical protein [Terriglobus sp. TAA 43]